MILAISQSTCDLIVPVDLYHAKRVISIICRKYFLLLLLHQWNTDVGSYGPKLQNVGDLLKTIHPRPMLSRFYTHR